MSKANIRLLKIFVFTAALLPLALLVWKSYNAELGANPIEVVTHSTGDWTLIFLLLTLAVTPLRRVPGLNWLIGFRRMLGLFAFFYGSLHFTTYVWFDKFFDLHDMVKDIEKRRFITVGLTGFTLMIPLAITSTKGMIRRLGGKRWNRLHQLIYLSACAGVIHYYWLVKKDTTRPLEYAAVLSVLLLYRVWYKYARRGPVLKPAPRREPAQLVRAETQGES